VEKLSEPFPQTITFREKHLFAVPAEFYLKKSKSLRLPQRPTFASNTSLRAAQASKTQKVKLGGSRKELLSQK
jgi:hypothetical protein